MILVAILAANAAPVAHELGVGVGVGYQGGDTVVAGGLGGDVQYRLGVGDHLQVHARVGPRLYLAPALEADLGVGWRVPFGRGWSLTAGIEGAAMFGGVVRRVAADRIDPVLGAPWAVRVFVDPIEYRSGPFVVRTLGLAAGVGVDDPGGSLALGVHLFEVGFVGGG